MHLPYTYLTRPDNLLMCVCVQCMCLHTKPKRDEMSPAFIRGLLNCQMGEGREKGREREKERHLPIKEESTKKKIDLFSFSSIIQDVYYVLLCAAANFMPQRFLTTANN